MEWILQVANEGVLPAMALYQVLHLRQDPLSAATSHSSGISTRNRSSSPPLSKDRASSQGSAQPDVPKGPTEEDILATASLTVAEIIAKLKGVMATDEDNEEGRVSAIVEDLCDSAIDKVLDELLHYPRSSLSEFYSTSISEDLILNAWQDAKENIWVLADIHAISTGSGRSSASSIGQVRCDSEPHNPSSQRESLSGILAHHALFQTQGVFTTEEKLKLVRLVGGILQGIMARERRSLNQPKDADTASLPQNISSACNIIHLVLENFSAAVEFIRGGEVDFLRGNGFTLLVESLSESLLSKVTEEVEALRRRNQGVSSGRSSRRSRSQGELLGNWVKGKEEACTLSCKENFPLSTQQEERRSGEEYSSASDEEKEEEEQQKEARFASRSLSPRSPSPRSKANSHNLNIAAHKMLDTVVQMAYSASNDEDCDKDKGGSSVGLSDQAEYDLGRLLASHSMCTRMLQARIQCFSMELIGGIYQLLLDTEVGPLPPTRRCRSEPNVQNPEAKQHLDWELFTPMLYNFIHLAFKKLMENFLGLLNSRPEECVLVNEWMCKKDRTDSIRDVFWDSSGSSDSSDCMSLEGSYCTMPGPSQGTVGRNRPSSSVSQDQRKALEAISDVLSVKVGSVLQCSCNDPEKAMAILNKGREIFYSIHYIDPKGAFFRCSGILTISTVHKVKE